MPKLCFSRLSVVGAFLVAEDADGLAAEAAEAADDGGVVAVFAVAGERQEIGDQRADVIEACGRCGWRATCVFCQGVRLA